jgi:outer membrane protein assembly factor BamB
MSDYALARFSGTPELGQMLAEVSRDIYTGPWKMFAGGFLVFLTVLGFNLLGEGLRIQANGELRPGWLATIPLRLNIWWEERVWVPVKRLVASHPSRAWGTAGVCMIFVMWGIAGAIETSRPEPPWPLLNVPGGHLWASNQHDPYGTYQTVAIGPRSATVLWTFINESGFSGGPVVSANGTIFQLANDGTLYVLDPAGDILWTISIGGRPVGSPALGLNGEIYVADDTGRLLALDPDGRVLWELNPPDSWPSTSGPIVSADGVIYYTVAGDVRAVSPDGKLRWQVRVSTTLIFKSPAITPDGKFVYLGGTLLNASDGAKTSLEGLQAADSYAISPNGHSYVSMAGKVFEWRLSEDGTNLDLRSTKWDTRVYGSAPDSFGIPKDGEIWLDFRVFGPRLLLLDDDGHVQKLMIFDVTKGSLVGIDAETVFYYCGLYDPNIVRCQANHGDITDPLWKLEMDQAEILPKAISFMQTAQLAGGALVPGRIYVATQAGAFYAIGETSTSNP